MILCKDSGLFDPLFCSFITTFELESIFFFVFFAKWKKLFNVKSGKKERFRKLKILAPLYSFH